MATWDTINHYYSGQGVVMLGKRDAITGKAMGYTPIGNVSELAVSVDVTTLEHKENQTGQRATDLRLTTETKCSLSMALENFIASNLADALRGESIIVAAGSVTDDPITVYLGKVVPLPHIKVSALSIMDGVTPLVAGTDYTVNEEAGSIKFADTIAGVVDGEDLTHSYEYAAQTNVEALTSGATELAMRFEGLNTAEGNNPVIVEVFKFLTDPLKELSLISDTVQKFTLEGSVLADSSRVSGSKFFKVTKLN
jgi:hypothetical protein